LFAAVHESINKSKRKKIAIGIKTHTIRLISRPSIKKPPRRAATRLSFELGSGGLYGAIGKHSIGLEAINKRTPDVFGWTHELRSRSLINALCEFWAAANLY
jgi:hypothetical protein